VRQLHSSHAALFMNETDNASERFDVFVTPDTKVLRTDPAFRENCRRLGQNQSSAADGAAAEMNKMPIVNESVDA
jgi:hypothetical protein